MMSVTKSHNRSNANRSIDEILKAFEIGGAAVSKGLREPIWISSVGLLKLYDWGKLFVLQITFRNA
jgi:hypothetical protein